MKDTGGAINGGDNGVVLEEIDLEETKTRLFGCSLLKGLEMLCLSSLAQNKLSVNLQKMRP